MFQDICSKTQKCTIQKQNHQGGNILDHLGKSNTGTFILRTTCILIKYFHVLIIIKRFTFHITSRRRGIKLTNRFICNYTSES